MTAPRPLPPCPVCRNPEPESDTEIWVKPEYRYRRQCMDSAHGWSHEVIAWGRTQAEADARWRRLVGGAR